MISKDDYISLSKNVFDELIVNNFEMTRDQILDILNVERSYYNFIINGLSYIQKVVKVRGRTGGIQIRRVKGLKKYLAESNINDLKKYYDDNINDEITITTKNEVMANDDQSSNDSSEDVLYKPLKEYLDQSGYYDFVEIYGDKRGGSKWENVDLISVAYPTDLKYQISFTPEITSYEVKPSLPSILDIQQTASYLRFSHRAYLSFYDESYKGDYSRMMGHIKDNLLWDWAELFRIGLLIIYKKQDRSKEYAFQVIKEAPYNFVDINSVDEAIDAYLSSEAKSNIKERIRNYIKTIL